MPGYRTESANDYYKRLLKRRTEYSKRLRIKYPHLDSTQVSRIVERKIR